MILKLPAPAKINLHLHITAIRADGMHELDTSFAFTQACDWLHIQRAETLAVSCSKAHLSGEKNLVHRLLQHFADLHGIRPDLYIHIDKQIPEQAGLGGGSSDAATALLAANSIWGIHAPVSELITFAAPFGADIPCFLFGRASHARGIGEALCDYPCPLPEQALLMAWPGCGLSTAEVFKQYDMAVSHGHLALTLPQALSTMRAVPAALGCNDLEATACQLSPEVERLLGSLRACSEQAWMSGSGSSCVALFDSIGQANQAADELQRSRLATWVHVGHISGEHPLEKKYWDVAKR